MKFQAAAANRRRAVLVALSVLAGAILITAKAGAQQSLPFEVSNPKHLKWDSEEALRIYSSGSELVAQFLRRQNLHPLQPKFLLVLGAKNNETVHSAAGSEVRLRTWDASRFAEAVVVITLRQAINDGEVVKLAYTALLAAESTVSVSELKHRQ